MAACDKFTINVKGKGGHGAAPQQTVDAIVEAAAVVTALQTIVSRNMVSLSAVVAQGLVTYDAFFSGARKPRIPWRPA